MDNYNIEFYSKENGEEPARKFILELEPKMQAKVLKILDLLQVHGPNVRLPYSEHLDNGIFEIRAKQSTNISRVLYFFTSRTENNINKWIRKKDAKNSKKRN